MLKTRIKRIAEETERALERLVSIEVSVKALADNDLLDLANNFAAGILTPLRTMTDAEMRRRSIGL